LVRVRPAHSWATRPRTPAQEQHAKIVRALNDTAVSLTIRSAEGLAMFQGLSNPLSNGDVYDLLEKGHRASVAQALGETPAEAPASSAGHDRPADTGEHSSPA
jgi:hypothetical protein